MSAMTPIFPVRNLIRIPTTLLNRSGPVRSDLDFSLKSINLDIEGRSIIMEAEVQGSLFLFVNIYAPNKVQDQHRFFEDLNQNIEGFVINKEHRIIVGGNFNVTLDSDFDCSGGKSFRKDYWLINDAPQDDIEKSDIIPSINSDQSAIFLYFNSLDKPEYGPSFWKFMLVLSMMTILSH